MFLLITAIIGAGEGVEALHMHYVNRILVDFGRVVVVVY
jgi:hypothetical protein